MTLPQIFISATTRDLESFRKATAEILLKKHAFPVVQEHFPPDHRSVVAMLQDRIGQCGAAICLVGRCYGHEPPKRDPDEPRRSYTQLEYENAVELGKPVFVFLATDDCTFDSEPDESEEIRELQRQHIQRILDSGRLRMTFHSLAHLTEQVRIMDLKALAKGPTTRLVVLLVAELIDVESQRKKLGEDAFVRDVVQPFRKLLGEARARWQGTLSAETTGEYGFNFQTADAAVNAALALHTAVPRHHWSGAAPELRVGIHVGQIVEFVDDEARVNQTGHAMEVCRQLTRKGVAGQTLLSRTAYDIAREHVRQAPPANEDGSPSGDGNGPLAVKLNWRSHGRYLMSDAEEVLDIYEVGAAGVAPFLAPPGSIEQQQRIPPWRPAVGQEVPRSQGWFLERKLGEGGFGEVWVARNDQITDRHVFKFCFDASGLSSLERERTLFNHLRGGLGKRDDIARLIDLNLKEGPYFLESEYVEGGNLRDWGEATGRLAALPLDERLELLIKIAVAVAAAHSVGVIHKDLKPGNIFMRQDADGRWHPVLADFGIGEIDHSRTLKGRNITVGSLTISLPKSSSSSGSPMYQPPEAISGGTATVQWDVFALGVVLYQLVIGDFGAPVAPGWERKLDAAVEPEALLRLTPTLVRQSPRMARVGKSRIGTPHDPTAELAVRFLKEDVGACLDVDPAVRLESAAQLIERLRTIEKRVADARIRQRAELARRRMKRLRVGLVASLVALAVVGGLGLFAYREWGIAQEALIAEQRAEKIASDAVDEFFTTVSESDLSRLPKTEGLRERFLTLSMDHLAELKQRAGKGLRIDARIARAHFYVGRMHDWLHEPEKAVVEYSLALKSQVTLLDADPQNSSLRRERAETGTRFGLCSFESSPLQDKAKAREIVVRARDALLATPAGPNEPPRQRQPGSAELGDPALDFELAKSYITLGYLDKLIAEAAAGGHGQAEADLPTARAEYETARTILARLVQSTKETDPSRFRYEHRLALIAQNLGNFDRDAGSALAAALSYRAAADFWKKRLELARNETKPPPDGAEHLAYHTGLTDALRNLVLLETVQGRLTEAETFGKQSHEAAKRFVSDFGYDDSKDSLARHHLALGNLHLSRHWRAERRGEHAKATGWAKQVVEDAENSMKILDGLLQDHPKRAQYRDNRGGCLLLLAAPFAGDERRAPTNDLKSALEKLESALKIYQELCSAEKNPDYQARLATTWRMLGDTQAALAADSRERGDAAGAAALEAEADRSHLEARKNADDLIQHEKPAIFASQAGQHYCRGARFLNQAQDFKRGDKTLGLAERSREARELAERSIKILSDLLAIDSTDDRAKLTLIYAHQERALAQARLGDDRGAVADAVEALRRAKERADNLKGPDEDADQPVPLLYGLAAAFARSSLAARGVDPGQSSRVKEAESYADEALKLLKTAELRHLFADAATRQRLANDPDFQALRSDRRFLEIVRAATSPPPPLAN